MIIRFLDFIAALLLVWVARKLGYSPQEFQKMVDEHGSMIKALDSHQKSLE